VPDEPLTGATWTPRMPNGHARVRLCGAETEDVTGRMVDLRSTGRSVSRIRRGGVLSIVINRERVAWASSRRSTRIAVAASTCVQDLQPRLRAALKSAVPRAHTQRRRFPTCTDSALANRHTPLVVIARIFGPPAPSVV